MAQASLAGSSASSCAGSSPWPTSSQTWHFGLGFPVSCVLPRVFALALGVCFLLSKLLLLLGFPALTVAPPVQLSCHLCMCLGALSSLDGVSSPLPAPDSYLAHWRHKP